MTASSVPVTVPITQRIVVSLGTMPSRDCTVAVQSLLNQTREPDAIYVNAPRYSKWANRPSRIPPQLQAVGGARLHLLQPNLDRGPAEKHLGAIEHESSSSTIIVVVDDDWIYPPTLVESLSGAVLAHEARIGDGATVVVGGSGTRLPHNLSKFIVAKPGIPCAQQLVSSDPHAAVFGSALPAGCHVRVDTLQGFAGIAYRRSAVDLRQLSALVERAPPFLRYSDDLILAAHFGDARTQRTRHACSRRRVLPAAVKRAALLD